MKKKRKQDLVRMYIERQLKALFPTKNIPKDIITYITELMYPKIKRDKYLCGCRSFLTCNNVKTCEMHRKNPILKNYKPIRE